MVYYTVELVYYRQLQFCFSLYIFCTVVLGDTLVLHILGFFLDILPDYSAIEEMPTQSVCRYTELFVKYAGYYSQENQTWMEELNCLLVMILLTGIDWMRVFVISQQKMEAEMCVTAVTSWFGIKHMYRLDSGSDLTPTPSNLIKRFGSLGEMATPPPELATICLGP